MCVLALFLNPDGSLAVAANRDEAYARPSAPPQGLGRGIIGGKDLQGGGTWLGVNDDGVLVLVAVTNRREPVKTAKSWSRGLLAIEALNPNYSRSQSDLARDLL